MRLARVVLPTPVGPTRATDAAGRHIQVDAIQYRVPFAIVKAHVLEAERALGPALDLDRIRLSATSGVSSSNSATRSAPASASCSPSQAPLRAWMGA